jgi:hypothetical protein
MVFNIKIPCVKKTLKFPDLESNPIVIPSAHNFHYYIKTNKLK